MSAAQPFVSETSRPSLQGPVLVTGGAGYIGSHTVRALRERGVPTLVLDNLSTGHRRAAGADLIEADLGNYEALTAIFARHRPRSVVHFAAKCFVGESVAEPAKYYRENVFNTWNLLEVMRAFSCREIVFSSTCATYGNPHAIPLVEDHPQIPISPYGKTKLHMEHMMQDYGRAYGLAWAALRYFNAAGAASDGSLGEHHEPETHLIPLVLQVALGQRPSIAIFGEDYPTPDGTCVRDYIHVEDLAEAHLLALARLQGGAPAFACNLGTGQGYSVREVIRAAELVTGRKVAIEHASRREGDPPQLISGGTLAQELLGWRPQRPQIERILTDAWRFHCNHPHGFRE